MKQVVENTIGCTNTFLLLNQLNSITSEKLIKLSINRPNLDKFEIDNFSKYLLETSIQSIQSISYSRHAFFSMCSFYILDSNEYFCHYYIILKYKIIKIFNFLGKKYSDRKLIQVSTLNR